MSGMRASLGKLSASYKKQTKRLLQVPGIDPDLRNHEGYTAADLAKAVGKGTWNRRSLSKYLEGKEAQPQ